MAGKQHASNHANTLTQPLTHAPTRTRTGSDMSPERLHAPHAISGSERQHAVHPVGISDFGMDETVGWGGGGADHIAANGSQSSWCVRMEACVSVVCVCGGVCVSGVCVWRRVGQWM